MPKSVKNRKNVMKYSKKKRIILNRNNNKKTKNPMEFIGGGKEEQNAFIEKTFEKIKNMNIQELNANLKILCRELKENIVDVEKFDFTSNIRSFIVLSMLTPFLMEYVYDFDNAPYDKLDELSAFITNNVYLGTAIKENNLTSLTPYPEKSLELLNSCENNETYCVMMPKYLIMDYRGNQEYYCTSNDTNKIKRITKKEDLLSIDDGYYLYSILPNRTVCLFKGHHSSGSCGQPVICAGHITISQNKIIQIDNSSGHYSPPSDMLIKALELLKRQGLITSDGIQDKLNSGGKIKVFKF
jgi:hypothetical protein